MALAYGATSPEEGETHAVGLQSSTARAIRSGSSPVGEGWYLMLEQHQPDALWMWRIQSGKLVGVRSIGRRSLGATSTVDFNNAPDSATAAVLGASGTIGFVDSTGATLFLGTYATGIRDMALAKVSLTSRRVEAVLRVGGRQVVYAAASGRCGAADSAPVAVLVVDTTGSSGVLGVGSVPDSAWAAFLDAGLTRVVRRAYVGPVPHLTSTSGKLLFDAVGSRFFAEINGRLLVVDCASMTATAGVSLAASGNPVLLPVDGSIVMNDNGQPLGSRLVRYSSALGRLADIPIPPQAQSPVSTNALTVSGDGTLLYVVTGDGSRFGTGVPNEPQGRVLVLRLSDWSIQQDRTMFPFAIGGIAVFP